MIFYHILPENVHMDKIEAIFFTRKRNLSLNPIHDRVSWSSEIKYLGIVIDSVFVGEPALDNIARRGQ